MLTIFFCRCGAEGVGTWISCHTNQSAGNNIFIKCLKIVWNKTIWRKCRPTQNRQKLEGIRSLKIENFIRWDLCVCIFLKKIVLSWWLFSVWVGIAEIQVLRGWVIRGQKSVLAEKLENYWKIAEEVKPQKLGSNSTKVFCLLTELHMKGRSQFIL